ncbi:MAG: FAD/NAD(P)-binding protein, partial [Leucobacter sp.]
MTSELRRASIALVGAGPRGASLIERIGANLSEIASLSETADPGEPANRLGIDLHVIDPEQSGAGRIWRTDQTRELCMNTLAHAVTLFTEPGSTVAGPVRPGPTLYEWCLLVRRAGAGTDGVGADPALRIKSAPDSSPAPSSNPRLGDDPAPDVDPVPDGNTSPSGESLLDGDDAPGNEAALRVDPATADSAPTRSAPADPVTENPASGDLSAPASADPATGGEAERGGDPAARGAAAVEPEALDPEFAERLAEIPPAHVASFDAHPVRDGLAAEYRDELAGTRPESHPSRALYGEYLSWCYHRAVASLPAGVRVIRHRAAAVGIERGTRGEREAHGGPARDVVRLSDGGRVAADAVILATGWMPREQTPAERELAATLAGRPELTWVRPASPVEQPLDRIEPGSRAIVRGMGMGFFDTMALLTIGRGGRFLEDADAPGGLRYEPSGREPILHVTSRRGVPFRAKTLYGSLPPSPEQRFARGIDWSAVPRPIDFDRALWPLVVADAYLDYAETLARTRPGSVTARPERLRDAIAGAVAELSREQ